MNSAVIPLNSALTKAVDLALLPFAGVAPVWGLLALSLVSGVLLLLIYGRISNQAGIRRIKKGISAAMLEAVLYRHDIKICLRAQCRMFGCGFLYFAYAVPPIIVMMLPCVLLLAQLNLRYNTLGLPAGTSAILRVKVDNLNYIDTITIADAKGVDVTPRLRVRGTGEVLWRLTPRPSGGEAEVTLAVGNRGEAYAQKVALPSGATRPISAKIVKGWWWALLYPGEKPIPPASPISEISLSYPEARYGLLGLHWHWMVLFLVFSILSGLAGSKVFGVAV